MPKNKPYSTHLGINFLHNYICFKDDYFNFLFNEIPMKKLLLPITFICLSILANGCLIFHSVSYEIKSSTTGSGSATVIVEDIRSDALNQNELKMDKENLFDFMYKSDEFITQMKDEGKKITSRELIVDNDKLNGKISFDFDDIELVEGIVYEKPFYYLTIPPEDSVISTNGEIVVSDQHKRIIWDNSIETLKFTMFSDDVESGNLIGMAEYFEPD